MLYNDWLNVILLLESETLQFVNQIRRVVNHIQWGEQVFDTLPILQEFLITKHVDVCASTPALLAVWGFRLGFCTAL